MAVDDKLSSGTIKAGTAIGVEGSIAPEQDLFRGCLYG